FTVVTGVSGSGKSTLAFDIVFGEGQRRYLESLNAYAFNPAVFDDMAGTEAEFTTAEYGQIDTDESSPTEFYTLDNNLSKRLRFTYQISEAEASVTQIDASVRVKSESAVDHSFWIFNDTAGWEQLGTTSTTAGTWQVLSGSITANLADYIDVNGEIDTLLFVADPGGPVRFVEVDYAKVDVGTLMSPGTVTSPVIDYNDFPGTSTNWGSLQWNDVETTGSILYRLRYYDDTTADGDGVSNTWEYIPDTYLTGNAAGFGTSGVGLSSLDPATNTFLQRIKLEATLTESGGSPTLNDWTVSVAASTDTTPPTITAIETADLNSDGFIDAMHIIFDEAIDDDTVFATDFAIAGASNLTFSSTTNGDTADDSDIYITFE
ncbi:MAG: hypothetical protein IH951_15355, partial [Bacteroidetes bacterium]|nr:hypothetical protein [Bacteroidota bacterium]